MDNGGWTFSGDYVTHDDPDPTPPPAPPPEPPDPDIKPRYCGVKGLDPRVC